jgi:hypothetical protein
MSNNENQDNNLATLILISCGDMVRFEAPQPEGQSNEKGVPGIKLNSLRTDWS